MTKYRIRYFILTIVFAALLIGGCKDVWDDHNQPNLERLNLTLFEKISSDANLSTFSSYLEKTGYDAVLKSSKSFTVWAPSNEALKNISSTIVNDTAALKRFVGNCISNQSYFTSVPNPSLVIRMLNGKNTTFTKTTFESLSISQGDVYVKNGVLHVVNGAPIPKPNAWELLLANQAGSSQSEFIKGLEFTEIDTSKGVLLFKDPVTQKGVYQEGTTFPVKRNRYFQQIANISSEDSLVTYVILNNVAFNTEKAKLSPFYKHLDAQYADTLTKWSVVKDLVVNKVYNIDQLPDSMTTVTGVKIHLDRSAIVETHLLSNGIAYVVNNIGYKLMENKIPTVVIQGERPDSLRTPAIPTVRVKVDPSGVRFTDLQTGNLTNSPSPLHFFRYKSTVNSVTYAVYLRAVNDILASNVSMKVDFNTTRAYTTTVPLPTLGYKTIPSILNADRSTQAYKDAFKEVYLGTYTAENYGSLYTFLLSSLGATSAAPTLLSLDYLKLVPIN